MADVRCPVCLDTAIVTRDGRDRVLTRKCCTYKQLVEEFEPCQFCQGGELEREFWKKWEAAA